MTACNFSNGMLVALFSGLMSATLGLTLGEWKGTGLRTRNLLGPGLVVLPGSAVLSG